MIPVCNALSHFMARFDSPDSLAWRSVWIRYAVPIVGAAALFIVSWRCTK
jgi:hypothetical protein